MHTYHRRWTIESTFLELKTSFGLEGFRLTSVEAIERWFALCLVVHSMLQSKYLDIPPDSLLARYIGWTLRQYRNIKGRTLLNLKIFLEMCNSNLYGLQRRFTQKRASTPKFIEGQRLFRHFHENVREGEERERNLRTNDRQEVRRFRERQRYAWIE